MKTSESQSHLILVKKHGISFYHAYQGVKYSLITQPNFRVHFLLAFTSLFLGVLVNLTSAEWLVLILTIFVVIITEMINTSIESVVDLISKEESLLARVAKDTSAGAVLIAAVGSLVIGAVIFIPHFF